MAFRLKGSYVLALLFSAGIAGWMATGDIIYSGEQNDEMTPPPAERNAIATKEAVSVAAKTFVATERRAVLTVRGRTEADTKVTVRSETSAIVRERPVSKGQWVKKGDLLCELDIGSREAMLAQAEASLAKAEFDLKAKQTLSKKGFASKTEISSLTALRDAALATRKNARIELERTRITAPIDGIVQGPLAEIGDQLNSGGACATLMDPDPMLVVGQVSERDIGQVEQGATAEVKLVTGETRQGIVRYVSKASDVETRTFEVEVEIENKDRAVRDGVTSVAKLTLEPQLAQQMSPAHLTLSDNGVIGVMLVEDNKAKFAPVTILSSDQDGVWLRGLPEKATVITVGQEYVVDGQLLKVTMVKNGKLVAASNSGESQK